jgi:TatD DNase family protein
MRLFDSHCHIDFPQFDEDRAAMLGRMWEAGLVGCVAVSVELAQMPRLIALSEAEPHIWISAGVHPNHELDEEPTVDALCAQAMHEKCVAIGETGMDFFRHHVPPEVQEARFRTHIRAARRLGKPVIVHMREADADTLRVLREEGVEACGGIMHCFSSDQGAARQALDMGMDISFSGNVTFAKNEALRQVAATVPDEHLLIETDSPYLAPVPQRGKRNEPAYVAHVAECLAALRGVSVEALCALTTANAARRFGIDIPAIAGS